MPDDIDMLKQYKALIFHSVRKYRDASDITQTNDKWLSKNGRAYSVEKEKGAAACQRQGARGFHSIFNFYIPMGKYIVIPFIGSCLSILPF